RHGRRQAAGADSSRQGPARTLRVPATRPLLVRPHRRVPVGQASKSLSSRKQVDSFGLATSLLTRTAPTAYVHPRRGGRQYRVRSQPDYESTRTEYQRVQTGEERI